MRIAGHCLLCASLLMSAAVVAAAQSGIGAIAVGVGMENGGSPLHGVTNLPYSATFKTTVVQKLADGTTITRVSTTREARDSQGRTLHEITNERPGGQPSIVNATLNDPENHTMTHWMSFSKEATVIHLPEPTMVHTPSVSARTVNSTAGPGTIGSGNGEPQSGSQENMVKSQREKLGGKTIAGVYTEGSRITTTFSEGAVGNDRPFSTVRETWWSPELKIMLVSTNNDPRTGETTMEVTSIDRAEPDPSVFSVPEGYTVRDQSTPR
jgi:hypothetical protein